MRLYTFIIIGLFIFLGLGIWLGYIMGKGTYSLKYKGSEVIIESKDSLINSQTALIAMLKENVEKDEKIINIHKDIEEAKDEQIALLKTFIERMKDK